MAKGQLAITPRKSEATIGDDWAQAFTLWDDGAAKNVSTATDISAAVVDLAGKTVISGTACSSGATGAAWATGVVVLPFTATQTAAIGLANQYFIEIQVTLGGAKTTWPRVPVDVQSGAVA